MATFTGTSNGDRIYYGYVTSGVTISPSGVYYPTSAVDIIYGLGGSDYLDGYSGNDEIYTGAGNDTAYGGEGNDLIDDFTTASYGGSDFIDGGAGNDSLYGYEGYDSLYGGAGNDVLHGEDDWDTLDGGAGDDSLFGGDSNDTLEGGIGADSMDGGEGSDTYYVDNLGDYVEDNGGTSWSYDRVYSSVSFTLGIGVEHLELMGRSSLNGTGNELGNSLTGNDGTNVLSGLSGDDNLNGKAGADSLYGGDGDDNLDGGTGADYLDGGAGDDTYVVDSASDTVYEATAGTPGGNDTIELGFATNWTLSDNTENLRLYGSASNGIGNVSSNSISGTSSANLLSGLEGNDTLDGESGNDTLDGGTGIDKMYGSSGDDNYYVDSVSDSAIEYSYENYYGDDYYYDYGGSDTVISTSTFTIERYIESLTLTGSANVDGTGNGMNNTLVGNNGNNALNGLDGNDRLTGGLGNDSLNGGTGVDTMIGDAGNDTYYVDQTTDVISETLTGTSGGTDTVYANASFTIGVNVENLYLFGDASINASGNDGINDISGTIGNNYLRGFALADTLRAGSGNDTLDGGTGADAMTGGQGNDTYYVSNAQDTTIESIVGAEGGTDTVYATVGFTLAANVENLFLTGTAASNGVGNALNNAISGDAYVNSLRGLAGNDTFQSGNGADILIGGTGNDTFRFSSTVGSNPSARDIIRAGDSAVAFEKAGATLGDRIDLALVDANTGSGGTQHFTYGTSTGVGRLWATESGSNTLINGNTDSDSAIEFQIAIEDGSVRSSAYTGADFLLA